jgi:transposase
VDTCRLAKEVFAMAKTHAPYPPEIRRQLVELVRAGRNPADLAREFEPSAQAIRNWAALAGVSYGPAAAPEAGRPDPVLTGPEREELQRLRRENRQLKLEREILAKAAAWFAREAGSIPSGSSSS